MTNKKLYLVRGSEDGTIGIYSNVKKAYEVAKTYVEWEKNRNVLTYSQVCKDLKVNRVSYVVVTSSRSECTIEKWFLNW